MEKPTPFLSSLREWMEVFMRHSMRDFIRYSKTSGLSVSQIHVLFQIHRRGLTVSEIGGELGITNAAASQLIDRLVQEGLIVRTEDPRDRRTKKLVLTPKGLQILRETIDSRQAWLHDLNDFLSPAEEEQVVEALQVLTEKVNQLDRADQPKETCEEHAKV